MKIPPKLQSEGYFQEQEQIAQSSLVGIVAPPWTESNPNVPNDSPW